MSKFIIPIFIGILVGGAVRAADVPPADGAVLARVALTGPVTDLRLPVYARLRDVQGQEYVLVVATEERLAAAGHAYVVLDRNARAPDYLLARPGRRHGHPPLVAPNLRVVHDDGAQWVVRATSEEAEALAAAGFELQRLGASPMVWTPPAPPAGQPAAGRVAPLADWSPAVAKFMGEVAESRLLEQIRELSGELAVTIGGESYTIQTRNSGSGEPIAKATQFGYESFAALGLDVQYHQWAWGRNVIATRPGVLS